MKEIQYRVQGSNPDPYNITISKDGDQLVCICECTAAENGRPCKHWMKVFTGDSQEYIDLSEDNIIEIRKWLKGSDLEYAWNNYDKENKEIKKQEEKMIKKIKKEFSVKKKSP